MFVVAYVTLTISVRGCCGCYAWQGLKQYIQIIPLLLIGCIKMYILSTKLAYAQRFTLESSEKYGQNQ